MFSPRYIAVWGFVLIAVASAYPAPDKEVMPQPITTITDEDFGFPWMRLSPFSLFAPVFKLIPSFAEIGPRMYSDDNQFMVVVNVKDYKKEDLKVKVKGDLIFVQGSQEANHNNHDVFATQFFHTYSLPTNSSSSLVTAQLTIDGFLVVIAPTKKDIDEIKAKDTDREVPIIDTGAPYKKELFIKPVEVPSTPEATTTQEQTTVQISTITQVPTTIEVSSSTHAAITNPQSTNTPTPTSLPTTFAPIPVADEEVKEPIVPLEPEFVTEKDNFIPHENEISP